MDQIHLVNLQKDRQKHIEDVLRQKLADYENTVELRSLSFFSFEEGLIGISLGNILSNALHGIGRDGGIISSILSAIAFPACMALGSCIEGLIPFKER